MLPRNEQEQFIFKKSYEISYALFRIAGKVEEKNFGERFYALAAELLDSAVRGDHRKISHTLDAVEGFVSFGRDVNIVGPANAEMILNEVAAMDLTVADKRGEDMRTNELDLQSVFSKMVPPVGKSAASFPQRAKQQEAGEVFDDQSVGAMNSDIRQSAIIDKIRQIGNCRLRDIQEILPEYSERTLRYDIQSLLSRNLIERVGIAGPSVYYKIRQSA